MIGERYIKEWAATHPWRRAEQVEQDLLLSRVLVRRRFRRGEDNQSLCIDSDPAKASHFRSTPVGRPFRGVCPH